MTDTQKISQHKYNLSIKGKATRKRWRQSLKGKALQKRQDQSPKKKAQKKRYNQSDKGKSCLLKHRYNISLEEYNSLLSKQNNVCAICGGINKRIKLVVDHNHRTNKNRGLLCTKCNNGLAYLENPDFIFKATSYLSNYTLP